MSLNIDNIYCSQWLINDTLKNYCKNPQYKAYYINPHDILHIKDSINYKALTTNNFDIYHQYITVTKQEEHSVNNYKKVLNNFDIKKMQPLLIEYDSTINKYIIRDGVHRLSILLFKNIFTSTIPLKYFNIKYDNTTIQNIKQKLNATTGNVHNNGWNNRTTFGYHSFNICNINIPGQRNPMKRLQLIRQHVDFKNKTVLDFGCNSGGMLLHLPDIKKGIGYDFNTNCIKAANYINNILQYDNDLTFFVKDLNSLTFGEIKDVQIDVLFLLALGSWIKKWEELYTYAVGKCNLIVYETNNDREAKPQLNLFKKLKCDISLISLSSTDDITNNHGRKTYLIKCPKT